MEELENSISGVIIRAKAKGIDYIRISFGTPPFNKSKNPSFIKYIGVKEGKEILLGEEKPRIAEDRNRELQLFSRAKFAVNILVSNSIGSQIYIRDTPLDSDLTRKLFAERYSAEKHL